MQSLHIHSVKILVYIQLDKELTFKESLVLGMEIFIIGMAYNRQFLT
jgi:hypothetical protein